MKNFNCKADSTWTSCDDRREMTFTQSKRGENERTTQLDYIQVRRKYTAESSCAVRGTMIFSVRYDTRRRRIRLDHWKEEERMNRLEDVWWQSKNWLQKDSEGPERRDTKWRLGNIQNDIEGSDKENRSHHVITQTKRCEQNTGRSYYERRSSDEEFQSNWESDAHEQVWEVTTDHAVKCSLMFDKRILKKERLWQNCTWTAVSQKTEVSGMKNYRDIVPRFTWTPRRRLKKKRKELRSSKKMDTDILQNKEELLKFPLTWLHK